MALIPWPSRAAPAVWSAWRQAVGGSICAGAANAVISAAATVRPISTHQNTMPRQAIRSLRASSLVSGGSTTIARKKSSQAPAWPLRGGIRSINRFLDLPDGSHPTGNHCFTSKKPTPQRHAQHERQIPHTWRRGVCGGGVIRSPSDPDQTKTRRERGASRRQIDIGNGTVQDFLLPLIGSAGHKWRGPRIGGAGHFRLPGFLCASEPEADEDERGYEIGYERVGEAPQPREELLIALGLKSFRQFDIYDQQRHRERENAVSQCLEPASWDESFCLYRL